MAIEIVEFPMNSMVIFHSYVSLPEGIHHKSFLLFRTLHILIPIVNQLMNHKSFLG